MRVLQVVLVAVSVFLQVLNLLRLLLYFVRHGLVFSLEERLRALKRFFFVCLGFELVVELMAYFLDALDFLVAIFDEVLCLDK